MRAFTATPTLTRLALRRDRVQLPLWVLTITVVLAASASSIAELYDTEQARMSYVETNVASAVARAFSGAISSAGLGSIIMVETFVTLAVLIALMSTFAVVRHTRQNEETGRAELIGSAAVGRYAGQTAALIVVVGTNVVLALLAAAALAVTGLPVPGSLAAGAGLGMVGISFAGIAAIAAQVFESARAANGAAGTALGLAFLLRAAGDALGETAAGGTSVASAWPSWLSPLGWAQAIHPFAAADWWVFGVPAGFFVLTVLLAAMLAGHRDLGTGMIPVRAGPPVAPGVLLSALGLAWRLQRGMLFSWAAGMLIFGAAFGAVGNEVEQLLTSNEQITELIAQLGGSQDLIDAYFGAMLGLMGIATAGYAIQALLRMRAEESGGSLETLLAGAVSRSRWLGSHLACAVAGVVLILLIGGAGSALAFELASDHSGNIGGVLAAAARQISAALVLAGFAVAAFGLLPRLAAAVSWAALVLCLLLGQLGAPLDLPQAVLDVSPFTHVPTMPGEGAEAAPVLVLLAVAAGLIATGVVSFRQRDLAL